MFHHSLPRQLINTYIIIIPLIAFVLLSFPMTSQENFNTTEIGSLREGPAFAVAQNSTHLFFNNGIYVDIYEKKDDENSTFITRYHARGFVNEMLLDGDHLYLAMEYNGLSVLNTNDLNNIVELSFTELYGNAPVLHLNNDLLFFATPGYGINLFDVSDPASPVLLHNYDINHCYGIEATDQYLFTARGHDGFFIYDITDISDPVEVFSIENDFSYDVSIKDQLACVNFSDTLLLLDITNPTLASPVSKIPVSLSENCHIHENHLFASGYRLNHFDISEPVNPVALLDESLNGISKDISFLDGSLVIASTADRSVKHYLLNESAELDLKEKISTSYYAVCISIFNNYAYLSLGYGGLSVLDISNPENPVFIKNIPFDDYVNKTMIHDGMLYISTDGLMIMDISDPLNPVESGYYFTNRATYDFQFNNNLVYLAAGSRGLKILDVSDKTNPVLTGEIETPGTATNLDVQGNTIYLADRNSGLRIIDVSDPSAPVETGSVESSKFTPLYSVKVFGQYAWVGSSNFGLRIYDISDLDNPVYVNSKHTHRGFNFFFTEHLAFVSAGSAGVYVLNTIDPTNPTTIAHYDSPGDVQYALPIEENIFLADNKTGMTILEFDKCDPIWYRYDKTNPSCFDECDATIEVNDIENAIEPVVIQWNTGATGESISDLCEGIYRFTITDGQGCSIPDSVYVVAPPELYISEIVTEHITDSNPNASIQLTVEGGTPGYSYEWQGPNDYSSTSSTISYLEPGCYSVTIIDSQGCILVSGDICVEDQTTSVFNFNDKVSIYCFPNPVLDQISIFTKSENRIHSISIEDPIELYSLSGNLVNIQVSETGSYDMSQVPEGVYFLKVNTGDLILAKKIIVQR